MEVEELYRYMQDMFKKHKKALKPWRNNINPSYGYRKGWNECVAEIEKNHKKFIKFIEEQYIKATEQK